MSDFWSTKTVNKARKEHTCECCNSLIQIGESYENIAGVYEGSFFIQKVCPQCLKILQMHLDTIDNEYCLNEIIGEMYWEKEVYELLKQIKHPSDFVLSCIEDYEESLIEGE